MHTWVMAVGQARQALLPVPGVARQRRPTYSTKCSALRLTVGCFLLCCLAAFAIDATTAFRAECLAKAEAGDSMTVVGKNDWLFLRKELRHIGAGKFWGEEAKTASRASREDRRDPLPAILDFNEQLKALDIELLFVPVPPKAIVYPEMISDDVTARSLRLDPAHQEFYALLQKEGIRVIDLVPLFAKQKQANTGPLYCKSDTHWSGIGCRETAMLIADELKQRDWYKKVAKTEYKATTRTETISGDLGLELPPGTAAATETLELRFISGDGMLEPDPLSPVLIVADSHGLVFHAGDDMHTRGAGFWSQLMFELGFPPALIAVRGSGATPSRVTLFRKGKADPEFLSTKKAIIWLFSAREFTETSGWAKAPVNKN